jgi:hypothetical protein
MIQKREMEEPTLRPHRSTIAGVMAAVAFAAFDFLGVRNADFLAGCWLVGGSMQAGLFAVRRSVGGIHRFWVGFEVTGLGLLLAYIACSHVGLPVFDRWAYKVSESVYGSLRGLPPDAFQWCFEHGLVIDPQKPLKVYEVVAVFEIAYGLPMLILAIVGGFLAAKLGSQRALRPLATNLSVSDDP